MILHPVSLPNSLVTFKTTLAQSFEIPVFEVADVPLLIIVDQAVAFEGGPIPDPDENLLIGSLQYADAGAFQFIFFRVVVSIE